MLSRKKILFISSWYPVAHNPTHGIFVKRHAEAVSLLNDVCVLYCSGATENQSFITEDNAHFREYVYLYDKRGKTAWKKYRSLSKLYEAGFEKILKEWGRPDLIQLNIIFPAGIFAERIARKYKIPYVISENWTGYHPEDGSYKGLVKRKVSENIAQK